jgi:transposase
VIEAIVDGFLVEKDVLVLDNATIHTCKEKDAMLDWLWERHGIFVAFLPTWLPELNLIELV